METLEFDQIFNSYIQLPYHPEFLVEKLNDSLKSYNFELIQESKDKVNIEKFKDLFVPIFGDEEKGYIFKNNVTAARSIENFKNFVYEDCKVVGTFIKRKEIIYYLFVLDDFKNRLINAIYNFSYLKLKINDDKYQILLRQFLIEKQTKININLKYYFDEKYYKKWAKKHNLIFRKESNGDELSKDNITKNYSIYNYYGPETKFNYSINKRDKEENVVLFSPDFLIGKKLISEYSDKNFQIFNENNICPGLFIYILEETIKQLNNKLKGKEISEEIVNNIGIHYFKDNTVGVYVNMINSSKYYEMENLINKLTNDKKEDDLQLVVYSNTSVTESKAMRNRDNLTDEQDFYMQYSSHVNEEQLSNAIVNSIGHEILNEGMERMPRIIFFFNLYLFKSLEQKERIAFTAREKGYGFEEADGIFYTKSEI